MRKIMCISIAAVFLILLGLGIYINSQQGLYFQDNFWKKGSGGAFTWAGNRIQPTGNDSFDLLFSGKEINAKKSMLPDGGTRMDYSDGWAVERPSVDDFLFDFGGYAWSSDAVLIPTDIDALNLEFAEAAREERTPFYTHDGNRLAGETVQIFSEDGEILDTFALWYDDPGHGTPERKTIILEENARLPAEIAHSDYIILDADGRYLLNRYSLGMISERAPGMNRSNLAWFLMQIARGETEARGNAAAVFVFILLYCLGAAQLLWPEKLAFWGSRWQYQEEPHLSDAGLTAAYIGGGIIMLLGTVLMFAGL